MKKIELTDTMRDLRYVAKHISGGQLVTTVALGMGIGAGLGVLALPIAGGAYLLNEKVEKLRENLESRVLR